jgi:glutathione S-transferase
MANRLPNEPSPAIRLVGQEGSPYSNKMKALLSFRRIPFRWVKQMQVEAQGTPDARGPVLLPKMVFPDDHVMNDSTFLIKELESRFVERSVIPNDPAVALICSLLEDYADEWLTKAMFHYRWTYDIPTAGFGIGTSLGFSFGIDNINQMGASFSERQVDRKNIVGSNVTTGPVIEASFVRFCKLLEAHIEAGNDYLLGSRPSAADFAIYGQVIAYKKSSMPSVFMPPSSSVFTPSSCAIFLRHLLTHHAHAIVSFGSCTP